MSREDPRYVRFGRPRKSGRSFNHHKGRPEAGLSCYRGWMAKDDLFIIDASELNEEVGIPSIFPLLAAERPAYFVAGEEVGRGNDGEPLVVVEDMWRVPKSVNITCTDTRIQTALRLWSEGPRNNTARTWTSERVGRRLAHGGWAPDFEFPDSGLGNLSSRERRRKKTRKKKR